MWRFSARLLYGRCSDFGNFKELFGYLWLGNLISLHLSSEKTSFVFSSGRIQFQVNYVPPHSGAKYLIKICPILKVLSNPHKKWAVNFKMSYQQSWCFTNIKIASCATELQVRKPMNCIVCGKACGFSFSTVDFRPLQLRNHGNNAGNIFGTTVL